MTNYRKFFIFNNKKYCYPTANISIILPLIDFNFNVVLRSLGNICYYLLTGDFLFVELKYKVEYKIPINISLEAVSFIINMIKYYFYLGVKEIKLLNHPFVEKYFGDFTDFDKNIVSNFIKDEYLILNYNNIDKINSIINMNICLNN